jgi:hypothetical protein
VYFTFGASLGYYRRDRQERRVFLFFSVISAHSAVNFSRMKNFCPQTEMLPVEDYFFPRRRFFFFFSPVPGIFSVY